MQDLIEATRRATADIRQKDPSHIVGDGAKIGHTYRRTYKDILGEDGRKLSEEDMANGLWKMLDDMYEADPEEYKKFIEKQMKEGREAGFKLPGQSDNSTVDNANVGMSKPVPTKGSNMKTTGGSFTPNCGFVVKARKLYTGDKVFLNICSHPGASAFDCWGFPCRRKYPWSVCTPNTITNRSTKGWLGQIKSTYNRH